LGARFASNRKAAQILQANVLNDHDQDFERQLK
jgi:hypothetical protein